MDYDEKTCLLEIEIMVDYDLERKKEPIPQKYCAYLPYPVSIAEPKDACKELGMYGAINLPSGFAHVREGYDELKSLMKFIALNVRKEKAELLSLQKKMVDNQTRFIGDDD